VKPQLTDAGFRSAGQVAPRYLSARSWSNRQTMHLVARELPVASTDADARREFELEFAR